MFKETKEGQTHSFNDGCGEPAHNESKQCTCKEMTCQKDCQQEHTHKRFFCEKCEPEACRKMFNKTPEEIEIRCIKI